MFIEVCVYNTDSKQNIGLTDHLGHLVFLGALCGVRTVGVFTRKRRPLLALESPALPTILHSPLALPPSYAPEVMRRGWSKELPPGKSIFNTPTSLGADIQFRPKVTRILSPAVHSLFDLT